MTQPSKENTTGSSRAPGSPETAESDKPLVSSHECQNRNPGETPTIVAIDGPAGSGKTTVARRVARRLALPCIDTGLMYRAVAWMARRKGVDGSAGGVVERVAREIVFGLKTVDSETVLVVNDAIPGDELRSPEMSETTSRISALPEVRRILTEYQRRLGREKGCVMEGRDIGTVVFPDASVKIFLMAGPEERLRRRVEEMRARGLSVEQESLRREIDDRDRRDAGRKHAPMAPAPDAVTLVTDGLSIDDVVNRIVNLVEERRCLPGSETETTA